MIPPAVIKEITRVVGKDNIFISLEERIIAAAPKRQSR